MGTQPEGNNMTKKLKAKDATPWRFWTKKRRTMHARLGLAEESTKAALATAEEQRAEWATRYDAVEADAGLTIDNLSAQLEDATKTQHQTNKTLAALKQASETRIKELERRICDLAADLEASETHRCLAEDAVGDTHDAWRNTYDDWLDAYFDSAWTPTGARRWEIKAAGLLVECTTKGTFTVIDVHDGREVMKSDDWEAVQVIVEHSTARCRHSHDWFIGDIAEAGDDVFDEHEQRSIEEDDTPQAA